MQMERDKIWEVTCYRSSICGIPELLVLLHGLQRRLKLLLCAVNQVIPVHWHASVEMMKSSQVFSLPQPPPRQSRPILGLPLIKNLSLQGMFCLRRLAGYCDVPFH